jgi:hypothetical protein
MRKPGRQKCQLIINGRWAIMSRGDTTRTGPQDLVGICVMAERRHASQTLPARSSVSIPTEPGKPVEQTSRTFFRSVQAWREPSKRTVSIRSEGLTVANYRAVSVSRILGLGTE